MTTGVGTVTVHRLPWGADCTVHWESARESSHESPGRGVVGASVCVFFVSRRGCAHNYYDT